MLSAQIHLMPDSSFFPLLGIFLVVVFVLHFCVFRPVLDIIAKRHAATHDELAKAKQIEHAADGHDAEVHRELASLRELGTSLRANLRKEAQHTGELLIDEARRDGKRIIAEGAREREEQEQRLNRQLEPAVPALTRRIVAKMLFEEEEIAR